MLKQYSRGSLQHTAHGSVNGCRPADGCLGWLGVPYAQPPVGEMRWRAPLPPEPWSAPLETIARAAVAPQQGAGGVTGDEDCLYLDIHRPDTDEARLPVLFHIHGGSNTGGDSGELDATRFCCTAGCVVVSVNHRLGYLGFLQLPGLGESPEERGGNYALLDIARALDWVGENIAAFGGDPERVTVSGFSAGARNVMAMLISPLFRGEFHRAIAFSGGMGVGDGAVCRQKAAEGLASLVTADGLRPNARLAAEWLLTGGDEVVEYLRALPQERLVEAASGVPGQFPQLYNDGVTLPADGFLTSEGTNAVPLILYTGATEFSAFVAMMGEDLFGEAVRTGRILDPDCAERHRFDFVAGYANELFALTNTVAPAQRLRGRYGAPVYTCELAWGAVADQAGTEYALLHGPNHGSFLLLLDMAPEWYLREFAPYPHILDHRGLLGLRAVFTQYVRNFLHHGDPNWPELTLWPSWSDGTSGEPQLHLDCQGDQICITHSDVKDTVRDVIHRLEEDKRIPADHKGELIRRFLTNRTWSEPVERHFCGGSMWLPS